jgi:outer membrane lipoprotein LolB
VKALQWPRWRLWFGVVCTLCLVAACAAPQKTSGLKTIENNSYAGRISLTVQSEPVQTFAGGFDLQGTVAAGELSLFTPLGSTVAVMRWSAGRAELQNSGQTQQYPSVQAMLERTTGAAIPLEALFAWLRGEAAAAPGWQADVSRHAEGRISAQRSDPAPPAQLRIILEQ